MIINRDDIREYYKKIHKYDNYSFEEEFHNFYFIEIVNDKIVFSNKNDKYSSFITVSMISLKDYSKYSRKQKLKKIL